ncbi:MAG: hypothetical protein CL678_09900 [Bdellovibrionaceae bacterium]|nr:hypothetical protein [Pseudobdellovibrionaceae bacterium]
MLIYAGLVMIFLGLIQLMSKKAMVGIGVGIHLVLFGLIVIFVRTSIYSEEPKSGLVFSLLLMVSTLIQMGVLYSVSSRLYYLKKSTQIKYISEIENK